MQILEKYRSRPNMFVSFVDVEKLGINPVTEHDSTPLGIYAFPLDFAMGHMEEKTLPFASDRKFIYLFEGTGNLLDLQAYSDQRLDQDFETLCRDQWTLIDPKNEVFAVNMLKGWFRDMPSNPGEAIYRLTGRMANRGERIVGREKHVIWNSIFRKLDYSGVVDNGGRIIHTAEEAQAVFLSKSACRVIQTLINDHLK